VNLPSFPLASGNNGSLLAESVSSPSEPLSHLLSYAGTRQRKMFKGSCEVTRANLTATISREDVYQSKQKITSQQKAENGKYVN